MLLSSSAIALATRASTPRALWLSTRMPTSNRRSSTMCSHSTSTQRPRSPRSLATLGQSWVCTSRPWPLRSVPMIGSPGMGWQQRASCTATPSEPRMLIAPAGLGLTTSGRPDSRSCASARRRATMTGRRLPRPRSEKTSFLLRTPRSRRKRSHAKLEICPRVSPCGRSAWLSRRSPSVTDSSCWAFFMKWRICARALPVRA